MTNSTAQQLWQARINATKLPNEFDGAPGTEAEAYQIQAEMIAASGLDVTGWKIGATNEGLFDMLGVSQPFLGPLFQRFTHDSGVDLKILDNQNFETEFTVRLKADLPARSDPYERAQIAAAVGGIHPSFEIVGARFEGEFAGAGCRIIADGGANVGTVLGAEVRDFQNIDLGNHGVTLSINGRVVNEGHTSVLLWYHIFDALGWILGQLTMSARGLRAGDIIMTGTCTGITPLSPGDEAVVDFGDLGQVRAQFSS